MAASTVTAYIAVGANIRPEENVQRALSELRRSVRVTATSTFYRTPAIGRPYQAPFVNGVWRIETHLPPWDLKYTVLREVEARLGRVRSDDPYADRPIVLDVVLYGNAVLRQEGLVIPDPDITRRPLLAVPLLELAPDLVLPGSGMRLADCAIARQTEGMEPLVELTERLRRMLRE